MQAPELSHTFDGAWFKAQNYLTPCAASKELRLSLYDPTENNGFVMLDSRRTSHRHEIWIEETGTFRLWVFGDFSTLLVKSAGLNAAAHPMVLRLKRKFGKTSLLFKRRHQDASPQLWFKHPDHMTRSYGVHIGMSDGIDALDEIRSDAQSFLRQNPFMALPYDWTGLRLYHWQRPRLKPEDATLLERKITLGAHTIANAMGIFVPNTVVSFRDVQNGRPGRFEIETWARTAAWQEALAAFLEDPILGPIEKQVNYRCGGKTPDHFPIHSQMPVDFAGHTHMSIASSALKSLERISS